MSCYKYEVLFFLNLTISSTLAKRWYLSYVLPCVNSYSLCITKYKSNMETVENRNGSAINLSRIGWKYLAALLLLRIHLVNIIRKDSNHLPTETWTERWVRSENEIVWDCWMIFVTRNSHWSLWLALSLSICCCCCCSLNIALFILTIITAIMMLEMECFRIDCCDLWLYM